MLHLPMQLVHCLRMAGSNVGEVVSLASWAWDVIWIMWCGYGIRVADIDFLKLGGRVLSLAGALGGYGFWAILDGGGVRCWGRGYVYNFVMEQNIGDDEHPEAANLIPLGESAVQIAMGANHACALLVSGGFKCWGHNSGGQLGWGHTGSVRPENLIFLESLKFPEEQILKIVTGGHFSCVLLFKGGVQCWGHNGSGQLGQGHRNNLNNAIFFPVIAFADRIIDIEAGGSHVCTLLQTGAIRCWGQNSSGQLALGHRSNMGDDEMSGYFQDADMEGFAQIHPRMSLSSSSPMVGVPIYVSAKKSIFRGEKMSFSWDFGDGTTSMGAEASHSFSSVGMHPIKLTLTDGNGESVSVTRLVRVRPSNYAPDMPKLQRFTVEKNKATTLNLAVATDYEGDGIAYTLSGGSSVQGTLSECLGGTADLVCKYEPPTDFTGTVTFSYRGHDGNLTSLNGAQVRVDVVDEENIVKIVQGNHSCALYENKKSSVGVIIITDNWGWGTLIILEMMNLL